MNSLIKKFRIKSFKEENPIIELRNLSISYGNRQIVEKLNLNIQKSEISGLLGPNGAGKSTIYHSIIGLLMVWMQPIFQLIRDVLNLEFHGVPNMEELGVI